MRFCLRRLPQCLPPFSCFVLFYQFVRPQFLLEAELAVVKGDHFSVLSKYTIAVAVAREAGMMIETAIANERAGRYFFSMNNHETGRQFMIQAFRSYREWGCVLKLEHLKKEYGEIEET